MDRYDERTFDSDDFPKVVFRDQLSDGDTCGTCGEALGAQDDLPTSPAVRQAVSSYLEAALWTSTDDTGQPLDDAGWTAEDFDTESLDAAERQVAEFWDRATAEGLTEHWDPEQFGHDFWLTRNGEGTGFWDRDDYGSGAGDKLADMSSGYGPSLVDVVGGSLHLHLE